MSKIQSGIELSLGKFSNSELERKISQCEKSGQKKLKRHFERILSLQRRRK